MLFKKEKSKEHFDKFAPVYDAQANDVQCRYKAADQVYQSIESFLTHNPEAVILDVGCGTGLLAEKIRKKFSNVTIIGADISDNMLDHALDKQVYDLLGRHDFQNETIPFPDGSFDLVISSGVFDYFKTLELPVNELTRVTKEGGELHVTTYDSFPWQGHFKKALVGAAYLLFRFERARDAINYKHPIEGITHAFEQAGAEVSKADNFRAYYDLGLPVQYHLIAATKNPVEQMALRVA